MLTRVRRIRLRDRSTPPSSRIFRAPTLAARWNCLFLFAPDGRLDSDQAQILARVRALAGKLLIVVATRASDSLPQEVGIADALVWKSPEGFDFSAYALALDAIASHSPGAIAYLQNDSVLGPFGYLDRMVTRAPWDLTGFIGSPSVENHLSSFALIVKDVTPARLSALSSALSPRWCYNDFAKVVMLQETRLARVAARFMTVGAFWYLPVKAPEPSLTRALAARFGFVGGSAGRDPRGDATLSCPLALLDRGFPFMKRSLFTKYAGVFPQDALRARLSELGWLVSPP